MEEDHRLKKIHPVRFKSCLLRIEHFWDRDGGRGEEGGMLKKDRGRDRVMGAGGGGEGGMLRKDRG